MAFLTDLAANATEQGLNIIIYSGNDDSLVPHLGSQGKYLFSFTVFLLSTPIIVVVIQVRFVNIFKLYLSH